MLANPTALTRDLAHEVDVMHADRRVDLVAVFGPEHGFRGTAQAGGSQGSYDDPATGLPVYDLYAKTQDEITQIIGGAGIDVLLVDIVEIGVRYYTYIWSMYQAMVACARLGIGYVVLDRPSPLGASHPRGPVLHPALSTFVGLKPIAMDYAMTMGELARLDNAEFVPDDAGGRAADLTVVPVQGWRRDDDADTTGLPWVLPSPNIPTLDSAFVYAGNGLFEGTNLSEGRGTTKPFETVGAPYADYHWAATLNDQDLPGVAFREAYFSPTFSKYVGQTCAGVELHVNDRRAYDPVRTAVAMIVSARRLYPDDFAWRYDTGDPVDPYDVDKLAGSSLLRDAVDAGQDTDAVVATWHDELRAFERIRSAHLMYR
ncbi:exo-beta-N-acetylmuramidase NamZ family protein [Nocardioides mangrovicus]|nr:DUF1343 domain-containing protein [Nocardioides mangrovicus]